MVNKNVLSERLEKLGEYISLLEQVQEFGFQRFLDDPLIRGAAERNLHLAIECLLDIGNHIIVDRDYRKPESYADIFLILTDNNLISHDLFQQLDGMSAFRNLLVHDYLRLDPKKVFGIIATKTPSLARLGRVFSELL